MSPSACLAWVQAGGVSIPAHILPRFTLDVSHAQGSVYHVYPEPQSSKADFKPFLPVRVSHALRATVPKSHFVQKFSFQTQRPGPGPLAPICTSVSHKSRLQGRCSVYVQSAVSERVRDRLLNGASAGWERQGRRGEVTLRASRRVLARVQAGLVASCAASQHKDASRGGGGGEEGLGGGYESCRLGTSWAACPARVTCRQASPRVRAGCVVRCVPHTRVHIWEFQHNKRKT